MALTYSVTTHRHYEVGVSSAEEQAFHPTAIGGGRSIHTELAKVVKLHGQTEKQSGQDL